MIRVFRMLIAGCFLAPLMWTAEAIAQPTDAAPSDEQQKATSTTSDATTTPPVAEKPKRELKPAMAPLRDLVRRTLSSYQSQPFNTHDNLPTEIMSFCSGFGCNTEVLIDGVGGKKINGITCLCWNYPCAGYEMLAPVQGHIAARIGYGHQEYPGQFLAMLAMSRVPATYPIRSGRETRTIADLVEAEKLGCRAGSDMSLTLIGLAYYVDSADWKNDLGEEWSLEQIVRQEIAQPIVTAPDGGLNRLLGLTYTVNHRAKHDLPIDGQYQRAQTYVGDFCEFALGIQNSDGTWGPSLLAAKSTSADAAIQLQSTGRVLEWLALALPDNRLEEPRVIRSTEQVARLLGSQRYQRNVPMLPSREIAAIGHAVHGLALYDERVFKPADVEETPAAEKPATETSASGKPATASR